MQIGAITKTVWRLAVQWRGVSMLALGVVLTLVWTGSLVWLAFHFL
jgi:hypothetical protein